MAAPKFLRFPADFTLLAEFKEEAMAGTENPARTKSGATSPQDALELSTGRVRDIAALRGLGFSYREIAEHYQVTPQAISLLLARNRHKMSSIGGHPEIMELSTRATNALGRLGVTTREQATAANAVEKLRNARNCGRKTLTEIEGWMAGSTLPTPVSELTPVAEAC